MLWRVLTRSLGLISTLILARILVPSDFGLIVMATAFSSGIEAISQLGLREALVRRQEDGLDLHHTAFTMQVSRAFVTGLAIASASPAAAWWFNEPRLIFVVLVLSAQTVLSGFENVGTIEYRRSMRFDVQFKLLSIPRLVGVVTTLACALAFRSYWAMLVGFLATSATQVLMSYLLHPFRPRLRLERWRELAGFSFWTWATAAASLVWDRCDPFVLGPAFGSTKLGIYLLTMQVALLPVTELVTPAADVLFTAFAYAQKEGESSLHRAPEMACIVLLGVAPVALGLSAASGPIVEILLGPKWAEAWPIAAVLSWVCVFSPFSFICSTALVANGYVKRNFWANVIASAEKLMLLLGAVSLTYDATIIGAVTVACVAIEAITFTSLLRGAGSIRMRAMMGALIRINLAMGLAAVAVNSSGQGWQSGVGFLAADLRRCVLIGGIITVTFAPAVLLLWQLSGRPDGAEKRLIRLVKDQLGKSRRAWRLGC
jgi:lipopolysaccharide exporter